MKTIIIVRHGEYETREGIYRLSESGHEQMKQLGEEIASQLNGQSVALLSSTAPRALDSSEVLGELLGVIPQEHELLWSDNDHSMNTEKALGLVSQHEEVDVLIVVTHLEYSESLPGKLAHQYFGSDGGFPYASPGKGGAWVISLEKKTVHLHEKNTPMF